MPVFFLINNKAIDMKKILFTNVLLLTAVVSFAQLSGGLKSGVNFSNQEWKISLSGFGAGSEKIKGVGFHVGGYLNYKLSEVISLQPELMYNMLKFDSEDSLKITLNYLSLPVMLGFGVENNKFIFQAGPQIGFLLSADPSDFKDGEYIKNIDFSFAFGGVLNLGKFNIGIRYAIGLTNLAKDKLSEDFEDFLGIPMDLSVKNNNLQFSVGYKLFGEE